MRHNPTFEVNSKTTVAPVNTGVQGFLSKINKNKGELVFEGGKIN